LAISTDELIKFESPPSAWTGGLDGAFLLASWAKGKRIALAQRR
jgi:hypothetical protein